MTDWTGSHAKPLLSIDEARVLGEILLTGGVCSSAAKQIGKEVCVESLLSLYHYD